MAEEHPLHRSYSVWYRFRNTQRTPNMDFKQGIKNYGSFSTVEGFWHIYSHMLRPEELPFVDISIFEEGISPVWEDPANGDGGQWFIKLHKSLAAYCWEGLLLALVGNQLRTAAGDAVNGICLSVRYKDTSISVWNKASEQRDDAITIPGLLQALELDDKFKIEYRKHGASQNKPESTTHKSQRGGFSQPRVIQRSLSNRSTGFAARRQPVSPRFGQEEPWMTTGSGYFAPVSGELQGNPRDRDRPFGAGAQPAFRKPLSPTRVPASTGSANRFTSAFGQPQQQWEPLPHGRNAMAETGARANFGSGKPGFAPRGPRGSNISRSNSSVSDGGQDHSKSWRQLNANPNAGPTNSRWASE